ncbi:MAG: hypothetical protein H6R01_1164 [Burkholderiaceae bacterium]|nr:hypothetical protein [Burkholderiaceae bacterium]
MTVKFFAILSASSARRIINALGCLSIGLLLNHAAHAQRSASPSATYSEAIASSDIEYTVKRTDTLAKIRARFGIPETTILRENGLPVSHKIRTGDKLRIVNPHIVPAQLEEGILINLPQRMLYYFEDGKLESSFPVSLGKPDWPTPSGSFYIANRQENKAWVVPKSIQEEMKREGKAVITEIPPGPKNPLGKHWLGLSLPGYGIHGTIAPASIYRFRSHGCIRMHPDDIQALFDKAEIGMEGRIIYTPVMLAHLPDGRIFVEVHTDVYKKAGDPMAAVRRLADSYDLTDRIDWQRVKEIVRRKEGMAREVTLAPTEEDNEQASIINHTQQQQRQ